MRRRSRARVDNEFVQRQVETARAKIFEEGAGPGGTKVDRYLKDYSLLPTRVSNILGTRTLSSRIDERCS